MPLKGQLFAKRSPPLSDVKSTSVSRALPLFRSASSTQRDVAIERFDHRAIGGDGAAIVMHGLRQPGGDGADRPGPPTASEGR